MLGKIVSSRAMVKLLTILAFAGGCLPAGATTLEQLTLSEVIQKSTAIVRAQVTGSVGVMRGADIYTVYRLDVLDTWKSSGPAPREVAIPGGVANGLRQVAPGAPALTPGAQYVLFLWTSRSGLTQVIGLTQGVFTVRAEGKDAGKDSSGGMMVTRAASTELMLDASGRVVHDAPVTMKLADLKGQVLRETQGAAQGAMKRTTEGNSAGVQLQAREISPLRHPAAQPRESR